MRFPMSSFGFLIIPCVSSGFRAFANDFHAFSKDFHACPKAFHAFPMISCGVLDFHVFPEGFPSGFQEFRLGFTGFMGLLTDFHVVSKLVNSCSKDSMRFPRDSMCGSKDAHAFSIEFHAFPMNSYVL